MKYNTKYNILFVTNFFPDKCYGGIERVTDVLASYFHNRGIKCHCIYLHKCETLQNKNYIICNYMPEIYNKSFLRNYVIENNIKFIINQSNPYYTPFLRQVCDSTGAKLITCLHNSTECKAQSYKDAILFSNGIKKIAITIFYPLFAIYSSCKLKKIHRSSCILSDMTILLSKSLIKPYMKVLGLKQAQCKITYINNPLSFKEPCDTKLLDKKKKIVLVVARLDESQKKLSLLFNVWRKIEKYNDQWKLIVVGDGPDKEKYEKMVRKFNLKNIIFKGKQDSYNYYKEASIFCMTSSWEGFPMTLLESIQMGVVPIAMNSFPAINDILKDDVNSFIIKYGDIKEMTNKIYTLINNQEKLKEMQYNAMYSSKRFEIGIIYQQWENIFKSLF